MYQRLIFYIGMLFQHVYVSAEIQKTVLLLLIVHAEMHKTHPKNNRPRHWKPNAWPIDFGRDEATRTPDPYVPNVVRYQLSKGLKILVSPVRFLVAPLFFG